MEVGSEKELLKQDILLSDSSIFLLVIIAKSLSYTVLVWTMDEWISIWFSHLIPFINDFFPLKIRCHYNVQLTINYP